MVDEPAVHEIGIYVCDPCLDGHGAECHVPACVFCFHDVPRFTDPFFPTLRKLIDGRGTIDGKLLLDGELHDIDPFVDADDDEELIDEDPIDGPVGFFKRAELEEPADDSDLIDEDPNWECPSCGDVYSARTRPVDRELSCYGCDPKGED